MRVMLSNGEVVNTSPTENADLFRHVLGGYGLFGVILDVDLAVVDNEMYNRRAVYMNYKDFPAYYRSHIEGNNEIGLTFGRLSISPGSYLRETVLHVYDKTQFTGSLPPLTPGRLETLDRFIINFSKRGGVGRWLRWTLEKYVEPPGRAVARSGLRMMPASPPLPLKFRRADFLRYGFKAGISDGAFPSTTRSSRRAVCLHPSCSSPGTSCSSF